ncbi:DUF1330 domain-containing protein [Dorea sp. D27]|uniref:DUF1330 domain-containing protein n=1 Tax=Dorea sp. D27 TaxID=658665 RepID=UPI0006733FB8|nr:DUF1330 domain-containing protein [Dorea sp. D27]KMZ53370.1 hypothetical protein HMPREF0980_02613 [Dorea sp. D27]
MVYFIVTIYTDKNLGRGEYDEYIREVRPLVEAYGGRYIVRSDKVTPLDGRWSPARVIVIEWESRRNLERCLQSEAYRKIASKRENSVDSRAVIVEG